MYAKCTKCDWKSWVGEKKDAPKTCPKCRSKVEVTEQR